MKRYDASIVKELAEHAGIIINGSNAWDIQVLDDRFYHEFITGTSLALGETYMSGWWDVEKLDQFFERVFIASLEGKVKISWPVRWLIFKSRIFNRQFSSRAYTVGEAHYDIDNTLYELMLGSNMVYSCGYWKDADTLMQAQHNKLDLICRKLDLKQDMKFLDIGCGWGSLVKFAVENYGVRATAITISKEQLKFAEKKCAGLPIEFRLQDYRGLGEEKFDAIASVGMVEHVGYKNYHKFMQVINKSLKPSAFFLLQTIGSNESTVHADPWIEKYIFPNSMIPSLYQLTRACENLLSIEDLHSFGPDYDKTLMAWYDNLTKGWKELKSKYDQQFYRMWKYYLLMCAAGFRVRRNQVWQILMTKPKYKGIVVADR